MSDTPRFAWVCGRCQLSQGALTYPHCNACGYDGGRVAAVTDSVKPPLDKRLPLRIGGVMRCCIATLAEYEGLTGDGVQSEGTVLPCKYCSSSLIVRDGKWEWNREALDAQPISRTTSSGRASNDSTEK